MTHPAITARKAGLVGCPHCGLVCRSAPGPARCPRCDSRLALRKADSLARTWALLAAAAILYAPANLLPMMESETVLGRHYDTIMSGIVYFWTTGSPGLAVLILTASILVPLLKLGALSFLAWSTGRPFPENIQQRMMLYRVLHFIGRWSMLDVFVVALMVGVVHFGKLANIEAGPAAAAFGAVVVLTMIAARSFDPRLMWDRLEDDHG
jgi:paraquat-inducible protein A